MKIYEGLVGNQAVKVGENYVVCLNSGYYDVDGKRVYSYNKDTQYLVSEEVLNSGIYQVIRETTKTDHYLTEDGEKISHEQRRSANEKLQAYWDDDYDEYVFDSLEQEFEVRKSVDKYLKAKPINVTIPEEKKLVANIEIVGEQVDTGSKFITSCYQIGVHDNSGVYSVNSMPVLMDEFGEIVKSNDSFKADMPTHGGMVYWKINNTYLFNGKDPIWRNNTRKVFLSLDDAHEYEKSLRKKVRTIIYTKTATDVVDKQTRGALYKEIDSIISSTISLEVKQKATYSKSALVKRMRELLTVLEVEE